MPFADFVAGYGRAILRLAHLRGDAHLIPREPRDEELTEDERLILFGGVGAFWALRGADIDASDGIPAAPNGRRPSPAWHAGREFALLRMREKLALDANDFRPLLRARIENAALALRRVRLRWLNGQRIAEEFD